MRNGKTQDDQIVRYILGEMSGEEQDAIEARYFDDDAFLKNVQSARDDLVDAYVRGKLPARRRRNLERRMKENPALRSRVAFAETLLRAVDGARGEGDADQTAQSSLSEK